MRTKRRNLVLNRPLHNAHHNRCAQQAQAWKITNAHTLHRIHDPIRCKQILPLCPIHHLPRTHPLPMFLLSRQSPPTMGQTKTPATPKRPTNRHNRPTRQPHPILLAHQRKQIRPPHRTILCCQPYIRIRLHIPSKIRQQHKDPHHPPNLHRHDAYFRPTQNNDWCD